MKNNRSNVRLNKNSRFLLIIFTVAIILFLLGIQYVIQVKNNRDQSYRTSKVLIDHVKNVLDNNKSKEQTLIDSLKEDYMTRAKAVSYIIDNVPKVEGDVAELNRVAGLISVDEIHLFDTTGMIYGGNVPKYYGYSFDSGEQIGYFKPMLDDKTLSMCQDVTPNTAEGKSMMYAICWNDAGTRMVQVGIEPVRLLEELRRNELAEVIENMPSDEGTNIVVTERDSWEIIAATSDRLMGKYLTGLMIDSEVPDIEDVSRFNVLLDGKISYCAASGYDDYIIAVIQDRDVLNYTIPLSIAITFAYLILAAVIIYNIFMKLTSQVLEEQRNANTDPMTGFYNRRAYETAITEYHDKPIEDRFVYVSMDLNGLKVTNDTHGHDEGDTLIKLAASCMKQCFGNFGRLFRIGGDEFVAMIFADSTELNAIMKDFERTLRERKDDSVMGLSVSSGYVRRSEYPKVSIEEMAKIADERMYKSKEEYYGKSK